MNKNTDELSRLLRSRRLALGERLEDVAARAGVDVAGLSRAENGKKIPAPETLASLADALDLPLADLYEAAATHYPSSCQRCDRTSAAPMAFRKKPLKRLKRTCVVSPHSTAAARYSTREKMNYPTNERRCV